MAPPAHPGERVARLEALLEAVREDLHELSVSVAKATDLIRGMVPRVEALEKGEAERKTRVQKITWWCLSIVATIAGGYALVLMRARWGP